MLTALEWLSMLKALMWSALCLAGLDTAARPAPGTGPTGKLLQEPASTRAVVLFFVASDCVVSDRYFPEVERLQREFAARGVRFWWVYPNAGEKLSSVQDHQRQFAAQAANARLDADGALTKFAGVHVTPESAVLLRMGNSDDWKTVYHGRIDDRYVRLGLERPHAGRHDLQDAIAAALAGKPALPPGGPAIGCAIMGSQR